MEKDKAESLTGEDVRETELSEMLKSNDYSFTDFLDKKERETTMFYNLDEELKHSKAIWTEEVSEDEEVVKYLMDDGTVHKAVIGDEDAIEAAADSMIQNPDEIFKDVRYSMGSVRSFYESLLKNCQTYSQYKEFTRLCLTDHEEEFEEENRMMRGKLTRLEHILRWQLENAKTHLSHEVWGRGTHYKDANPYNFYPSPKYGYLITPDDDNIVVKRGLVLQLTSGATDLSYNDIFDATYSSVKRKEFDKIIEEKQNGKGVNNK